MFLSLPEYGGLGLDFSYSVAVAEELGGINCGGIPMAIGVQTDMATPALARLDQHTPTACNKASSAFVTHMCLYTVDYHHLLYQLLSSSKLKILSGSL